MREVISPLTRQRLDDPELPGSRELINEDIPGPIAAAYRASGSTVTHAEPIQVTWWPGLQLTIRYRVDASGGHLPGRSQAVATVGDVPNGAVAVQSGDAVVGVWIVPNDPSLPGLRSALDIRAVTGLLRELGSSHDASEVRLRAYRPGRRAVVEAMSGPSSLFLKVVPPSRVAALHERHRFLTDHVPVPDSLGFSPDLGIVVMRARPGTDLRSILRKGGRAPEHDALARLPWTLPEPPWPRVSRSPFDGLPRIVDLLQHIVPEESALLERLAGELGEDTQEPTVPVHGDFHEAQILVARGRPVALLDVDTYGWGRRGDDPATMLAHLDLLAPTCNSPARTIALALSLNRHWDRQTDPADLRRRTAAVALGLAVGPFRVLRPEWVTEVRERIRVAAQWAESARRVDERSLIATSGASHIDLRR